MSYITEPEHFFNGQKGSLRGNNVGSKKTYLKDLDGFFGDEKVRDSMNQDTLVYEVQYYFPVEDGREGGLFFGITTINPGKVGDEYFMTKGHYHEKRDRGEYYWCITGEGMLILMDGERNCRAEKMSPESLHYIPGYTAHRVVNTGAAPLVFGACWPADAGHNYGEIKMRGFSARVLDKDHEPMLIDE